MEQHEQRKLICLLCKTATIDIPLGYNGAAGVLKHYVRFHADVLVLVDRHQLALQDPHVNVELDLY